MTEPSITNNTRLPGEGTEWPELLGRTREEAESLLRNQCPPSLEIVVVVEGSMVTMDHREDRVRLWVDEATKRTIVEIPRIG